DLEKRMAEASQSMDFERAAHIRDQIKDIRRVVERQRVVSVRGEDQDVLSYALGKTFAMVQVLKVREGKLVGREHFEVDQGISDEADELLTSFITQFYDERNEIPAEILLPSDLAEQEILLNWLKEQAGHNVRFTVPTQGAKKHLVQMAMENAQTLLAQEENKREWKTEQYNSALQDLAKALGLKASPRRIECFDISNTQGTQSVASMAVIVEGQPKGSEYRRFRIKTVEGPNDFASLQEAVGRRFRRGLAERDEGKEKEGKFATFPDLLVIDGGKGQLHAVCEVMKELGLESQPIIGLAKENEEIFVPTSNEPIILPKESPALHMLQRVRDEAHRFAITYHRSLRDKRTVASSLDQIPGIGPKRKQALLRHFGSVARIRRASLEELMQVEGMTEAVARAVAEGLSE
ncbi:MAG TPA: excinuclease ABC subunit UvrC, partial [Bacillota bacterium]|nr:excinuclease ABC subunit UvrC [Bacillota bacterium]